MARGDNKFLDKDAVITKGVGGLRHRRAHGLCYLGLAMHHTHTLTTAAGRCLYHYRIAYISSSLYRFINIADGAICSGDTGYTRRSGQCFRFDFVAHNADCPHIWANKLQTCLFYSLNKPRIFRQKPVSGMDCFCAAIQRSLYNHIAKKIALCRRRCANMYCLICHAHMRGDRIRVRINSNRFYLHLLRGSHNPASYFTTVRNKNFFEHIYSN